jgi:DNA polymerase-3 subunit gamma/tau
VLDQLVAGAEGGNVSLAYATSLLGYTDAALLDDVIDAFAARRGSDVFEALDRALDAGLDPRRFVSDLLERFRDLLILAVSGADATEMQALVPRPPDERERMTEQAKLFGPAELTRNAELLATGLTEMRGATAPRLILELVAARMLLPTVDDTERQLQVRLEQLERQVKSGAVAQAAPTAPRPAVASEPVTPPASPNPTSTPAPANAPAAAEPARDPASETAAIKSEPAASSPAPEPAAASPASPPAASSGAVTTIDDVRRMWPQIVESVKGRKRSAWIQLNRPGAGVLSVSGDRLALGLPDAGTVKGFVSGGYGDVLRLAVLDVMGVDVQVDVIAQSAPSSGAPKESPAPKEPSTAPVAAKSEAHKRPSGAERIAAAKAAAPEPSADADDDATIDLHSDSADDGLSGEELLAQALDAKQIGEIQH